MGGLFMGFGGGATVPPPLWHGGLAMDKPRVTSYLAYVFRIAGHPDPNRIGELPKAVQTCLIYHQKSASAKALAGPALRRGEQL